jgi:hypothetical protein
LENIKKYLSLEAKEGQGSLQYHSTDEITDNTGKSNGESTQQGHENEGNEINRKYRRGGRPMVLSKEEKEILDSIVVSFV